MKKETQREAVERFMADGRWRFLQEIAAAAHAPTASVSARLRDMRRDGWDITKIRHSTRRIVYRAVKP